MTKNLQMKILICFFIIGILFITGISVYNIFELQNFYKIISNPEMQMSVQNMINNHKLVLYGSIGIFTVIIFLMGLILSKIFTKPIKKLLESVEKITAGEDVNLENTKINNTQIGEIVNAFSMMTGELKQNINEIERQKKQIETILLHMTDGVIAFNIDGRIIHINPAAKNLLKLDTVEDTFEKVFKKIKLDINMEKLIYLNNWTSSEHRLVVDDKYINLFFVPYQDENDRTAGVIVVIQDITEHVKLDNMRKEFVADVSHELKTPITSIMGYADTLLEGEYDKEMQNKFLGVISSEARRMARLVTDLLTLSKYDNKKIEMEETKFDLGELTKKCQEKLRFEFKKKNQNVECFVTANVPPVEADKDGIERVILNILSNAIKYTPENGNIKIYVGFVYNDAYIKVIDNGIGISEKDLSRIFERFYRADKARSREMGGTGLGLSIAKEILDKNKGSIDIKSQLGKGTEVIIRIPAKK